MKKLTIFVLLFGALWQFTSDKFGFDSTLKYAKKNAGKPWASTVVYAVGMAYYQGSEYRKSQDVFTSLLTDYPTGQYTARALLRLSEVQYDNRDYSGARTTLDRFFADFPDHPDTYLATKRREMLYNK